MQIVTKTKELVLTLEEAKALYEELRTLFPDPTYIWPNWEPPITWKPNPSITTSASDIQN